MQSMISLAANVSSTGNQFFLNAYVKYKSSSATVNLYTSATLKSYLACLILANGIIYIYKFS